MRLFVQLIFSASKIEIENLKNQPQYCPFVEGAYTDTDGVLEKGQCYRKRAIAMVWPCVFVPCIIFVTSDNVASITSTVSSGTVNLKQYAHGAASLHWLRFRSNRFYLYPSRLPHWRREILRCQCRHNGDDGVSNHQPHGCLLNSLFRHMSKKTSKLRVTGHCEGKPPVTGEFPAQRAVTRKMFPLDESFWLILKYGWIYTMKYLLSTDCETTTKQAMPNNAMWCIFYRYVWELECVRITPGQGYSAIHYNRRDGVPNQQPHHSFLNRLFRRRSKKTLKFRVTGLCVGNSPVIGEFPHKYPVTQKMFSFVDVIMHSGGTDVSSLIINQDICVHGSSVQNNLIKSRSTSWFEMARYFDASFLKE